MYSLDRNILRIGAVAVAAALALCAPSYAQKRAPGGGGIDADAVRNQALQQQENDFANLLKEADPDKKIAMIDKFEKKYPTSMHKQVIEEVLVRTYYGKQDWDDFYPASDKALADYPDDIDVLTLTGWVIPHIYNPADPQAAAKLTKAETYEKHALELIAVMQKPDKITDDQFAVSKATSLSQAHSGLGLVYFRKHDWDDASKELQQATTGQAMPDPTDLYALGFADEQLNHFRDAADAYDRCSAAPGPLQARCTSSSTNAKTKIDKLE